MYVGILGKPSNKKRWKSSIFFFFGGGVRRFPSFLKLIFRINLISIFGGGGFGPKMEDFHLFLFEGFPNSVTASSKIKITKPAGSHVLGLPF